MSCDGEIRRRVVLGLGNPGERYAATRHNVGFRVLEELARRRGIRLGDGECNSRVGFDSSLYLAAPLTYMNRSGYAAKCLSERHGFEAADFLIVYDEIHLPLGTLRLRRGGSPAGHRGIESVLENLGTDRVARLRLGVGAESGPPPGGDERVEFVLAPFTSDELETVDEMIVVAAEACDCWAREGIEAAMQKFNRTINNDQQATERSTGNRTIARQPNDRKETGRKQVTETAPREPTPEARPGGNKEET